MRLRNSLRPRPYSSTPAAGLVERPAGTTGITRAVALELSQWKPTARSFRQTLVGPTINSSIQCVAMRGLGSVCVPKTQFGLVERRIG